jgi:hypothetical protein
MSASCVHITGEPMFMYVCIYVCMYVCMYVCIYIYIYILLEDITTEPHAHDISADIVRVWLSGYILQYIYIYIYIYRHYACMCVAYTSYGRLSVCNSVYI